MSDYLNVDGIDCYIGDRVYTAYNVIAVKTYEYDEALKVATELKEKLQGTGFELHNVVSIPTNVKGYGIVITGVLLEEVLKWQDV